MEKEKNTTEAKILAAAEEEFMAKGYAGAKTMAIAERAGVTHAMLHYYFRTKDRLFDRVYEEKIRQMGESILAVYAREDLPFVERIREGVSVHFDFIAANPQLPGFVIHEMVADPAKRALFSEKISRLLETVILRFQREADELASCGEIERVDMADLMVDIASLNIFVFVAYPIIEPLVLRGGLTREEFLARKKRENIEVILRRIRKLPDHETSSPFYF